MISLLPFRAMYLLSDILYFFIKLSGYRRKVVRNNIRNSFPEKNDRERGEIEKNFFKFLCDLTLETLKTLSTTEDEAKTRCVFHKQDWLDALYSQGISIVAVMGHYGNWEWAGPSFSLNNAYKLVVVYRPLSNPYFEKMTAGMRSKFGTEIVPVQLTLRKMIEYRDRVTATAFIADQTAAPESGYWTTFLHQETAVYNGPEKLAKKFNYPVVFMNVKRVRRGYYEIFPELLCAHPNDMKENEISELFMRRLETEIVKDPAPWLWSHRRWKHIKPEKFQNK
jgi:KDO2-lipid IV(A) lauroyltransferase